VTRGGAVTMTEKIILAWVIVNLIAILLMLRFHAR
jgi:hypothetical protein